MNGWIKLYRSITSHWIWDNEKYLKAWITMILKVNHDDAKILIHGELIDCKRGQSLKSLNTWAREFGNGWTMQKTRTFFMLLKNDSMINIEGLRKTTRLTICNYDTYQDTEQAKNTQTTSKQQANNKQTTTNKKNKEGLRINTAFEFYKSEAEKSKSFSDDISKGYLEFARHICKKDKSGEFEMYYFLLVDKPLSLDHYYRLRKKPCDAQEIIDMADQIQNKVDYHYSYTDVYKTFNTWLNRKK